LKKVTCVHDAVAAPLEYFDLAIETLYEAAGLARNERVRDFFQMIPQRLEETIKAGDIAICDALHPTPQSALALTAG
jgi:hypothetical protein